MSNDNSYKENLHQGAKSSIFKNAIEVRQHETEPEKKLWQLLRNRQLKGKKFRRQHAIDKYILDFYCHECKLAIEIDGGIHDTKENIQYDTARTKALNEYDIRVMRFRNEEVTNEIEKVMKKIEQYL